jgi:hypothetical protein
MAESPKAVCLGKSVDRKRLEEALGPLPANGRHPHLLINKHSCAPG